MVCKHVCRLGKVLTAATPRLEERFDADLKEDRILQAQHGGSQKLSFTERRNVYWVPVTLISPKPTVPLVLERYTPIAQFRNKCYNTINTIAAPPLAAEYYPPQVLVRGSITDNSASSSCEKRSKKWYHLFLLPPSSLKSQTALEEGERA